jgi:chromosome partitioning protein
MIIGVSNLKGGVGKTTIAQNLAVCFAHMGFKTCIVDTDTNSNSLSWSAAREEDLPSITVVGSTEPKAIGKMVREMHKDYEIIVIDGTPSLSEMTTRIILASDMLLIPLLPSAHDLRAMSLFFERYEQAKELKEDIPAFFILNQYAANINVHRGMKDAAGNFGLPIFETTINKRASYVETALDGRGVYESSDQKAKEEVINLTTEVLAKAKELGLIGD